MSYLKEISRVEKDDVVAAVPSRSTGRPEGGREAESDGVTFFRESGPRHDFNDLFVAPTAADTKQTHTDMSKKTKDRLRDPAL